MQADTLEGIPESDQGVPLGQKLILIDSQTLQQDDLHQLFHSLLWSTHSHNLIALYNVAHTDNIEKEALRHGVRGFMYRDDSTKDLINGICAINSGELWVSRNIISECLQESYVGTELSEPADSLLSDREVELLRVLTTGGSNDLIADKMCISPHTVKTHLHNIFNKINVTNRLQAVLWAKDHL